ncbi:MAG: oligoendopeptidase F [Gemmiger sp.]|uniref:oligoendopeptidase F n=1 Tax=Gemmiger sp. TaxID=2049027 RepID=UPI002A920AA2|nr:oligoendopeptidase F [Gemmiger sp.]MDY5325523.1 oligoendopeptidase F [Gemmiger sp.]
MSEILKERRELDPQDQWDLTRMYASDAEWETAFAAVDPQIDAMPSWEGKLNTAEEIRGFYDAYTDLFRTLGNLAVYANLRLSEDTRAADAQSMEARITAKYVRAISGIAFAQPEILSLPDETMRKILQDPRVEPYRFVLEDLVREKPHTLSAPEEKLLARFGEVFGAPKNIADNLMDADLVFDPVQNQAGETVELSGSNYILLQTSEDRTLRENSFRSFYRTYRQHINTFAASYSGAVKASVAEAAARHYSSSRAMSMAGENIPEPVYDNLVSAVRGHLPDMYRYVSLRKRILGLQELHYYDVYAPLTQGISARYTYDQAKQMVLDAVAPLGEEYCSIVRKGFSERWIDVYPNKGKTGGAYSSGNYDSSPYILTNFTGTLDSVSTIAHEMGHSMHTWFSNHTQPPQTADYTLFVAEVASTVNENLLIEHLLSRPDMDPQTRLALLNQYLENFKGTVFRQTMFAEFEREAHAMAERGEALNPASLNALYEGLVKDYFGPELVMDEEVAYEWARIPHFYRPFYVYKYATGYSCAVALSEAVLREGEPAVKRYLEFLHMGGSAYPLDELRHAGVDLTTPAPVNAALDKFGLILSQAERCVEEVERQTKK